MISQFFSWYHAQYHHIMSPARQDGAGCGRHRSGAPPLALEEFQVEIRWYRGSAHWILVNTAPTLESCTYTLVLVKKYVHKSNKKATLRPLLKIYKRGRCGSALELNYSLKLFTAKNMNWRISFRNYAKCATSHHWAWEGNACVPFQWFSWFYSVWFSTFRLSLTIP